MGIMEKVRQALAERHLKPADLARITGFSPSRISKWFAGEGVPSVYQAFTIAKALDVPLIWLADDEQVEPSPFVDPLNDDEKTVLKLTRELGGKEAIRRLLHARDPSR